MRQWVRRLCLMMLPVVSEVMVKAPQASIREGERSSA